MARPRQAKNLLRRVHSQAIMEDMTKHCSECGAPFECVQATGCWCAELPWRLPVPAHTADQPQDPARDCLCPKCLPERLGIASQRPES